MVLLERREHISIEKANKYDLIDRLQRKIRQEKEEKIELRHENYVQKIAIDRLQKELTILKYNYNNLKEERKDCIHTDKIIDKIKELEDLFDKNEKEITIQYQNQFVVDVVGILEDLLKESD